MIRLRIPIQVRPSRTGFTRTTGATHADPFQE